MHYTLNSSNFKLHLHGYKIKNNTILEARIVKLRMNFKLKYK